MADRPLRPATHHSLGEPLPHLQANGPQADPEVTGPEGSPSSTTAPEEAVVLCGISSPFELLSPASRYVTYVLLTRAPLFTNRSWIVVRLACVKRAASVRSEPGSNSPVVSGELIIQLKFHLTSLLTFDEVTIQFSKIDRGVAFDTHRRVERRLNVRSRPGLSTRKLILSALSP